MTAESKSKSDNMNATYKGKKRKQYLPHNKPVKKKVFYPVKPGVQGFFITCDGGREHQASREAINVIDTFYEELINGNGTVPNLKPTEESFRPANKKIKFTYSDSSDEDEDDEEEGEEVELVEGKVIPDSHGETEVDSENVEEQNSESQKKDELINGNETEKPTINVNEHTKTTENRVEEAIEPPVKKQCLENNPTYSLIQEKKEEKSIDKLIEDEIRELGDKNKRRFLSLDSRCNGVVFVQMRKQDGDPGPKDIVQRMMTSAASTRKHMSRFILRVLPVEVSCYSSEEEISRAIKPLVDRYFPVDTQDPQKFAVLYDARANSGIDRMKIINSVAQSVPKPHKVDLNKPDKTIVVQIVKTVCLIGIVERYKELAKYNLRQLSSTKA